MDQSIQKYNLYAKYRHQIDSPAFLASMTFTKKLTAKSAEETDGFPDHIPWCNLPRTSLKNAWADSQQMK
jgi:hypothetical protein